MKKSSLIGHIAELLDLIRPLKSPADHIVQTFFRNRHYLGSRDRRFISDAIYDMLRNYQAVRFYASRGAEQIDPGVVSSLAMYIAFALKIRSESPDEVHASVESIWHLVHPKNDLRQFIDTIANASLPEEILTHPPGRLSMLYSFPETIVQEWLDRFGEEETEQLCRSLNQPAPLTIRVNTLKTDVEECRKILAAEGIETERTHLSPVGLTLKSRVNFQSLKSFKDGLFEIQDEGSQLLSMLLEPKSGETVVDACAGGGGKTLHIAALMHNSGELYALDVDERRLENIRPRQLRGGATIARLLHTKHQSQEIVNLRHQADAVLVDAPCSGVGTFRRNPAAKLGFTPEFAAGIAETQRSLLSRYADLVKPGGTLVYSTCTLLRNENERVVEEFLSSHPDFELESPSVILQRQGVPFRPDDSGYLTLLPHKTSTDGFFGAVMKKRIR